jgi:hypothetical protein
MQNVLIRNDRARNYVAWGEVIESRVAHGHSLDVGVGSSCVWRYSPTLIWPTTWYHGEDTRTTTT